jgi:carboxyl-terminal processing protease
VKKATPYVFVAIVLSGTALLGGLSAPRPLSGSPNYEECQRLLKTYSSALHLIEENYAEPIRSDKVIYGSIQAMLEKLDPHSVFLDSQSFSRSNDEMRGNYCGLGITFGMVRGKPTVTAPPVPGSPAYRLGIHSGDTILKVKQRSVEGLTLTEISELLKGPKGSLVELTLQRMGVPDVLDLKIAREEIPQLSVPLTFQLKPGIGYLRVAKFTETTPDELKERFNQLGGKLEGMILDLRGNHGGYLPAAITLAEAFLEKGQEVVTTKGRLRGANQRFLTESKKPHADCPLVVLIDRESASGSEIVAGAIQDHDRGLIVGEASFGKGLVQTVFPLSQGAGLWLTTAHYFTPSGRLIQRDYKHQSLQDYYRLTGTSSTSAEIRHTDGGREVYGGGGILPDIKISTGEIPSLTPFQTSLLSQTVFFDFVRAYNYHHPRSDGNFEVQEAILNEFQHYLAEKDLKPSEQEWQANLFFFREQIRYEYFLSHFGIEEAQKVIINKDLVVTRALDCLPQAKALLESSGPSTNPLHPPRPS